MKPQITLLVAALSVLNVSCNKTLSDKPAGGISQITATLAGDGQKTVIGGDGSSVLWSPGDEISVFYNEDGVRFTSINTKPKATTVFTSEYPIIYGGAEAIDGTMLYGLYPYHSDNAQVGDKLVLTVPSSQNATPGTFARGSFPSAGRSKNTSIPFYNVCGGIRFSLKRGGVWMVKITGHDGEILSGKVKIKFDESGHPVVDEILEGSTSVVLSTSPGSELQTGTWYYAAILPTAFSKGFTMEFSKNAASGFKAVFDQAVEIKRTTFGSLANVDNNVTPGVSLDEMTVYFENWSD